MSTNPNMADVFGMFAAALTPPVKRKPQTWFSAQTVQLGGVDWDAMIEYSVATEGPRGCEEAVAADVHDVTLLVYCGGKRIPMPSGISVELDDTCDLEESLVLEWNRRGYEE